MKITFARDEADFDLIAAWRIIAQILQKHDSVIGLSTGSAMLFDIRCSPEGMPTALVQCFLT